MAPPVKQNPEVDPVYLLTKLVELETKMAPIALALIKLEETNEGTLRTKGMKEKIAQAEQNIDANKQSFEKVERKMEQINQSFNLTVQEAFTEVKVEFAKVITEVNKRVDGLSAETQTQKGWITKWQPYLNVIAWVVTIVGGFLLSQFLTGHLKFVP